MHRSFGAILAVAFAALSIALGTARAERLADFAVKARQARIAGDKTAWLGYARKAVALAPEHQDLLYSLARAEALNGDADKSLALLADAVRRGGGFDLAAAREFDALRSDQRFKTI